MTGRPPKFPTDKIISAIETLGADPAKDVNVHQLQKFMNGGNSKRIQKVLEAYQSAKARDIEQADAQAGMARYLQLEQEVRVEAEKMLASHMQGFQALMAKAAEAERAKARRELDATREAFEMRLRERDAELERAKGDYATLCALLADVDGELTAAYASAEQLTAQRDATALERDRLAAEAGRLAAENARLAAEISTRKSRPGNAGAPPNAGAPDTESATQTAPEGPDLASKAGDCVREPVAADPAAAKSLQNTMFSLVAADDSDGDRTKGDLKPADIPAAVEPDALRAQARERECTTAMSSKPGGLGAPKLKAVGDVIRGPVADRAADGPGA